MDGVRAVMGSRVQGVWTVRVYPRIGGMATGRGPTFSEALGRALAEIASC